MTPQFSQSKDCLSDGDTSISTLALEDQWNALTQHRTLARKNGRGYLVFTCCNRRISDRYLAYTVTAVIRPNTWCNLLITFMDY